MLNLIISYKNRLYCKKIIWKTNRIVSESFAAVGHMHKFSTSRSTLAEVHLAVEISVRSADRSASKRTNLSVSLSEGSQPAEPVSFGALRLRPVHPRVYRRLISRPSSERWMLADVGYDQVRGQGPATPTAQKASGKNRKVDHSWTDDRHDIAPERRLGFVLFLSEVRQIVCHMYKSENPTRFLLKYYGRFWK